MSNLQLNNIINNLEYFDISLDNDLNEINGINGFNCYKRNIACGAFKFKHPNENSDCCYADLMLPNVQMKMRFWEVINCFGEFNKEDWERVYDSDNNVLNFNDDDGVGRFKCICSHNIIDLNFIRNKKYNIILLMGSECISKIDTRLADQKKVCKLCESACFGDNRKQPLKSGYCSDNCKNKAEEKRAMVLRLTASITLTKYKAEEEAKLEYNWSCRSCRLCNYFKVDPHKSYGILGYCSKNCSMAEKNRLCGGCLDFMIPRTQEWKTECTKCYKNCL